MIIPRRGMIDVISVFVEIMSSAEVVVVSPPLISIGSGVVIRFFWL